MNKITSLLALSLACLSFAACQDDFPTILNTEYAQSDDDTPDPGDEPGKEGEDLVIGSYNLWISTKGVSEYSWTSRRDVLAKSIVDNGFDIFGFQEADATIQSELPVLVEKNGGKYEWWFVGRDSQDARGGEAVGLAWNPERFELTDQHYFWLSETPDVLSYGWDEKAYHRVAACAVVKDKIYNKSFLMMVTHAPLSSDARAKAAALLVERAKMYNPKGMPSVLVGDMNAYPSDPASQIFRSYWSDSRSIAPSDKVFGPLGTFQSHNTSVDLSQESRRIDYIYVNGEIDIKSYKVDASLYGDIYPSDHCPVKVTAAVTYVPDEVEGKGTAEEPYLINSVSDWNEISASMDPAEESPEFSRTAYYKILNDIDFSEKQFSTWKQFDGVLDGGDHKLSGITAENETDDYSFGLIGVNAGTIRNMSVEASFTSSFKNLGGIAGTNNGLIDGAFYKGTLTGKGGASCIGGISGMNTGVIVNSANLGGKILAADATKSENCGGIAGAVAQGHYVINCYSWIERIESSNNNIGGVVGFVGNNSFVVNCYSTIDSIKSNGTYCSAVGYSKIGNVRNVYGNTVCNASKAGVVVANDKKAGTVWKVTTGSLLTLEQMKEGPVTVASTGETAANFAEALSKGAEEFTSMSTDVLPTKPDVTLRLWEISESYPVFK